MGSDKGWSIGGLADAAGVTPRTIRYYTAEGLLPPPERQGTYAHYGEEHLLRLRLIARLKAAYLPLREIRVRLGRLTVEQMREELAAAAETAASEGGAGDVESVHVARSTPMRPAIGFQPAAHLPAGPRAQLPARIEPGSPQLVPGYASILSQLVSTPDTDHSRGGEEAPRETWQRIAIAPGVEFHVREPLTSARREQVARLLELARDLLTESA